MGSNFSINLYRKLNLLSRNVCFFIIIAVIFFSINYLYTFNYPLFFSTIKSHRYYCYSNYFNVNVLLRGVKHICITTRFLIFLQSFLLITMKYRILLIFFFLTNRNYSFLNWTKNFGEFDKSGRKTWRKDAQMFAILF